MMGLYSVSFFFQAEDGIRDYKVTGVQTCALPILVGLLTGNVAPGAALKLRSGGLDPARFRVGAYGSDSARRADLRSGERRGGEECRSRGAPYHLKKKKE